MKIFPPISPIEIGAKLQSGSQISYTLSTGDVKDYTEDVITLGFSTREKQGTLLQVGQMSAEYETISILPSGKESLHA